jgi:hypothetical protein
MLFESTPFWLTLFSLGCHLVYSLLLSNFPIIQLSDPVFILSCCKCTNVNVSVTQTTVLVLADHFLWFSYFTTYHVFRFSEVAAFFCLCIWLVPFLFFISLSASDNTLPVNGISMWSTVLRWFQILNSSLLSLLLDPLSPTAQKSRKNKIGSVVKTWLNFLIEKKEQLLPAKATFGGKSFWWWI